MDKINNDSTQPLLHLHAMACPHGHLPACVLTALLALADTLVLPDCISSKSKQRNIVRRARAASR